jgi:hypothetical protein
VIAKQQLPMGRETLKMRAQAKGQTPTVAKVRAAIGRLRKAGIVTNSGVVGVQVEDRLLVEYITSQDAAKAHS